MGKGRSKGASKGKRYTRRRVKGGDNTPVVSVKSIGDYGFPEKSTMGSPERGYGFGRQNFTLRNDDIEIDDTTLYDSARPSKKSSKKLSLQKTSVWDGRVDYLKQMKQYIDSQKETLIDLQKKINTVREVANSTEEKELYYEMLATMRNMIMKVNKEFVQNYIKKFPTSEEKATKNLNEVFREQINILGLANTIEKLNTQVIRLNKNKTQKNQSKTGAAEPLKQLEIIQLIKRTSYGKALPNVEVEKMAATLKGQTKKNVIKSIKNLTVKSTRA
jgi:hypothetical protein